MATHITLNLDEFSEDVFERFSRYADDRAAALRVASAYYLADRHAGRPAWRVPRFGAGSKPRRRLIVRVDDLTGRTLAKDAARQGVSTAALLVHAVMYFMADVDSGRVARVLEESLGP